jgi:deoxycytidine triphosphate deaminase
MSVLVDHEINARLSGNPPLATGVPLGNFTKAADRIQAASLDLTIGGIFTPGTERGDPGGVDAPLSELTLLEGHTAVVRTFETLNLGDDLVAVGFPPASLSVRGLLMTNPGQVDPGYSGPLHLTVINMSQLPFQLRAGDRIIRVIFIRLGAAPQATYAARHPGPAGNSITPELMARLSTDFLDVEKRAQKIAEESVRKAQFWSAGIAGTFTILAVIVPLWLTDRSAPLKDAISKLEGRTTILEGRLSDAALSARLQKVEDEITKLSSKGR